MEDFCQIAGLNAHEKYAREGGLGLPNVVRIIRDCSAQPATARYIAAKERLMIIAKPAPIQSVNVIIPTIAWVQPKIKRKSGLLGNRQQQPTGHAGQHRKDQK